VILIEPLVIRLAVLRCGAQGWSPALRVGRCSEGPWGWGLWWLGDGERCQPGVPLGELLAGADLAGFDDLVNRRRDQLPGRVTAVRSRGYVLTPRQRT
jgi:hypothetical protein